VSPPADAPLHWAGNAHGEPATWDVREVIADPYRCTDCICDNRFLRAVISQTAAAGLGVVTDALRWASSKLGRWAADTRACLDKPGPPEQPCRVTLNTGGFVLVCARAAHPGGEHMDPAYGVWLAHGSGAPR
jgi:hypothetical protein